jgi:hypothetical protein
VSIQNAAGTVFVDKQQWVRAMTYTVSIGDIYRCMDAIAAEIATRNSS